MKRLALVLAALLTFGCTGKQKAETDPGAPGKASEAVATQVEATVQSLAPAPSLHANLNGTGTLSATFAPPPILVLWAFLGRQYDALNTINTVNTSDKTISSVIQTKTTPDVYEAKLLFVTAYMILEGQTKLKAPSRCSATADENNCCFEGPDPKCMADYNWEDCDNAPAPDLCRGSQKAVGAMTLSRHVAAEIAARSQLIKIDQIRAGGLPGGKLLLVWPWVQNTPEKKDQFLVTTIDGDLMDRLMTATYSGVPLSRRLRNEAVGQLGIECTAAGSRFTRITRRPETDADVIYVSIGRDTAARTQAGQAKTWSTSLYVEATAQAMRMVPVAEIHAPGGATSEWVDFSNLATETNPVPLHCSAGVSLLDLKRLQAQVNNPDSLTFLFTSVYLRELFREYTR